ncbi:MAG: gamma-butyrobetaine hydroxylase-like domain-containing protein, partial [Ilumatobacteraceae bacterium]
RGEVAWPRPGVPATISIREAELNGAWGLSIDWSDGHSTGIYAWSTLRRWWDAGMSGGMVVDPVRAPHRDDPAG